jgi:hypothetical protein
MKVTIAPDALGGSTPSLAGLQRMLACIARGQGPQGVKAKDVERAVGRYMPRIRDFKAKPKRKRHGRAR